MIILLFISLRGIRDNHVINFIQKITFLRFNLQISNIGQYSFLYGLRFIYYNYGKNALQSVLP
jgi:hypothetical protein